MSGRELIVGTRGSQLALKQARRVMQGLSESSQERIVHTSGDRFQDKPLHEQDGVGFFTKEIEEELLAGRIDLAVHSLKDLPTTLSAGLVLGAVLARDDAGDVLLVRPQALGEDRPLPLQAGSRVGASSLRRQALLRSIHPQAEPRPIRGNVTTRVEKLKRGDYDAIVLARAGLSRLALDVQPLQAFDLNPGHWICAPGQGAIAVEARADDDETLERVSALDDELTRRCVGCERTLLLTYGGGCHAPFGAFARRHQDRHQVFVAAPGADGEFRIGSFACPDLDDAQVDAQEWIRAGCQEVGPRREAEWMAQPARPWC